jgi:hypothetical protein
MVAIVTMSGCAIWHYSSAWPNVEDVLEMQEVNQDIPGAAD